MRIASINSSKAKELDARRVAAFVFLARHGPSRCSAIARFLGLKPITVSQWLYREQWNHRLWFRRPDKRWVLSGDPEAGSN